MPSDESDMDCVIVDDDEQEWNSEAAGGSSASSRGAAAQPRPRKKAKAKKRQAGGCAATLSTQRKRSKSGAKNGSNSKSNLSWTDSDEAEDDGASSTGAAVKGIPWATWVLDPPATMDFNTNLALTPPPYWADRKGGSEAANLLDTMGAF